MKKNIMLILLSLTIAQLAYSSGALRHILPHLSDLTESEMKEGELAYDDEKQALALKLDGSILRIQSQLEDIPRFPRIVTNVEYNPQSFKKYIYSKIDAGIIKFGDETTSNAVPITCLHDYNSPVIGIGNHDGSSWSWNFDPMYLYLIKNGSGFGCILSFEESGPISPFNSNPWFRVQTITGSAAPNSPYNWPTLITENSHTKVLGGKSFGLLITLSDLETSPFTSPAIITSTMKSIDLGAFSCNGADSYLELREKYETYDVINSETKTKYSPTESACSDDYLGVVPARPSTYNLNGTQDIHFTNSPEFYVEIPILGWTEIPASSI